MFCTLFSRRSSVVCIGKCNSDCDVLFENKPVSFKSKLVLLFNSILLSSIVVMLHDFLLSKAELQYFLNNVLSNKAFYTQKFGFKATKILFFLIKKIALLFCTSNKIVEFF